MRCGRAVRLAAFRAVLAIAMTAPLPIVGLPCDHRTVDGHPFDMVGEKYIVAVRDGAGATAAC